MGGTTTVLVADDEAQLLRLLVRLDLKTCRGSVVMRMDLQCRIKETYARGACRFGSLRRFR